MSSSAGQLIDRVVETGHAVEIEVSNWSPYIVEHVLKLAEMKGLKTTVTKGHEVKYDGDNIVPIECTWIHLEVHKAKCGSCLATSRVVDMIKTDVVEEKWSTINPDCQLADEAVYVCRDCHNKNV